MTDAGSLKALLDTATLLIADGDLDQAEGMLTRISEMQAGASLGPETTLGQPRRLHAAWLKLAKARGDAVSRIALQYTLVPPADMLASLFDVDAGDRRSRTAASGAQVPKVLHQIWIGASAPETTGVWRQQADRHGWEYRLWGEDALSEIGVGDDAVYRRMLDRGDLPGAVDVARYHVLSRFGGLYLDCDWMPVLDAPFEDVFPMSGLSAMAEETPRLTGVGSPFLNNSVICAPPGHPVFGQLIDALPDVVDRLPKGPAWWVTGPLVFTLACRRGPVTLLDARLTAGQFAGGREEVDMAIESLRAQGSSAFLLGWKPWAINQGARA